MAPMKHLWKNRKRKQTKKNKDFSLHMIWAMKGFKRIEAWEVMKMAKKIPLRQCLGCNQMIAKKELIRIVKDNENNFAIDVTGKMNGRGAYICRKAECLKKAIKSKSLERSFKMQIPKEVYDKLDKELEAIE